MFINRRNKDVKILIANAASQLYFKENNKKAPPPKPQTRMRFKRLLYELNEQWRLTHMNAEVYKGNKAA